MSNNLSRAVKIKPLTAKEFCKKHLARSPYDEEEWGYRTRCVRFLSQVLGCSERAVKSWGNGLEFSRMPDWACRQLAYLDALAEVA